MPPSPSLHIILSHTQLLSLAVSLPLFSHRSRARSTRSTIHHTNTHSQTLRPRGLTRWSSPGAVCRKDAALLTRSSRNKTRRPIIIVFLPGGAAVSALSQGKMNSVGACLCENVCVCVCACARACVRKRRRHSIQE